MALETRPIPVLKGKAARDFFRTLENCGVSQSKEEVQELTRKWMPVIEQARKQMQHG
ncbi:MAG: hypothetical protein LBT49_02740 [Prevotellaceae bacterium]|jgi:hypothetical protein|nr:hypothetical protein [Prevotellaceae bacterium]